MSKNIKKGDRVVVISGAAKGQSGAILQVQRNRGRVIVENVNLRKKHERKTQDNPEGAIIEREMPLHISNVMLQTRWDSRKSGGSSAAEAADASQPESVESKS